MKEEAKNPLPCNAVIMFLPVHKLSLSAKRRKKPWTLGLKMIKD
jgi:hypothetical protein